ncbi:hypothetical protein [Janthinobacterium sp. CG_23.3]|uniref:hypothetical protein n=1 Tax=Janthinobacterium sp. CG_23.3 TaxID=3349634 RepID=UPI0038D50B46
MSIKLSNNACRGDTTFFGAAPVVVCESMMSRYGKVTTGTFRRYTTFLHIIAIWQWPNGNKQLFRRKFYTVKTLRFVTRALGASQRSAAPLRYHGNAGASARPAPAEKCEKAP